MMPNVIFARPRHEYDSYRDLYRLIELSGYPLIYADEIEPDSDNCYIVTLLNGETQGGWPGARAEIILWDLEWRVDDPPRVPGVSRVWVSDPWYADQIGAQCVLMGSHPDPALVGGLPPAEQRDGVIALMYTGPHRRNRAIHDIEALGVTVYGPAWGDERATRLSQAAAMLHIHQHEGIATMAPLRWVIAANQQLPVLHEETTYPHHIPGAFWTNYGGVPRMVRLFMSKPDDLRDAGQRLHQYLCIDHPFRATVEAAL